MTWISRLAKTAPHHLIVSGPLFIKTLIFHRHVLETGSEGGCSTNNKVIFSVTMCLTFTFPINLSFLPLTNVLRQLSFRRSSISDFEKQRRRMRRRRRKSLLNTEYYFPPFPDFARNGVTLKCNSIVCVEAWV